MLILRKACKRIGIEGVSSHSFRRTALTEMSNAGVPLRIIQEVSGHRTLDELYKYLEVREDQVRGAVSYLTMLTPATSDNEAKEIVKTHLGKQAPGYKSAKKALSNFITELSKE